MFVILMYELGMKFNVRVFFKSWGNSWYGVFGDLGFIEKII